MLVGLSENSVIRKFRMTVTSSRSPENSVIRNFLITAASDSSLWYICKSNLAMRLRGVSKYARI